MELESADAALILADALEERGDPHAELIRAHVYGHEYEALLKEHWREWFGDLHPFGVVLRWRWGHLTEVGLRWTKPGWTLEERLPSLWAPRLTTLHTRVTAQDEARLFVSLAGWMAKAAPQAVSASPKPEVDPGPAADGGAPRRVPLKAH